MNPAIGILGWIIIGALAGWIGSKIMGTDSRQGAFANVVIGMLGGVVGGYVTRYFFHDNHGNNGLLTSFGVALLGSCLVILVWQVVSGRRLRV